MSFDFTEFKKRALKLEKMQAEYNSFISNFLLKLGIKALGYTKDNTPVDTGHLWEGWKLSSVKKEGRNLVIYLSNPVEYAAYVEYGHLTSNRSSWIDGQFMATLAIDRVKQQMPRKFESMFVEWVNSL